MQDRINRMNRLCRESDSAEGREEALTTTTTFAPPVDIYDDEHTIVVKMEVPGIDEKVIDVNIESNTLTVHGERKIEKEEEKEKNFRRVGRQYGSFTRSFTLPSSVDAGQVNAHYDKGVLKISLPKKAESKSKQIKVNVGSEKALEAKVHGKAASVPAINEGDGRRLSCLPFASHRREWEKS